MRVRTLAVAMCAATAVASITALPASAAVVVLSAKALALGHEVLPANDGWASSGAGTTGGSAADPAHISIAHNRAELVAALGGDNRTNNKNAVPKIIFIAGLIDGNTDDQGKPLTCADYAAPGYSFEEYLKLYNPETWGLGNPKGPLADARAASEKIQGNHIKIGIGSNTTIVGINGAKVTGANLYLDGVSNVIIRNLTVEDAHSCFPAFERNNGVDANWNSLFDTISVRGSDHVWIDHNSLSDGRNPDENEPWYFGRPYQVHDGLLDITNGSDLVTVSYNYIHDHDKTMLIGSSDGLVSDTGKLRVTVHHNRFQNLVSRAPRVRYGQVDVYDNSYVSTDEATYVYSLGVGKSSAIYAENNFFLRSADIPASKILYNWGGVGLTEKGSLTRVGTGPVSAVSLLDSYNADHDPDLGGDAGWTPTLRPGPITATIAVPLVVFASAGAGKLRT